MTGTVALYTWKSILDVDDIRRIFNAATFVSESVLLPASAIVDPTLGADERAWMIGRLQDLVDIGAVHTWAIESLMPSRPILRSQVRVVDAADYQQRYQRANESLVKLRREFLGQQAVNFDGIAEIVLGKHALFHGELAEALDAQSILHDLESAHGFGRFLASMTDPTSVATEVVTEVAIHAGLPDVTALPIEAVASARQSMADYRDYVISRLQAGKVVFADEMSLKSFKDTVVREIVEEFQGRRRQSEKSPFYSGLTWRLRRFHRNVADETDDPLRLLVELADSEA